MVNGMDHNRRRRYGLADQLPVLVPLLVVWALALVLLVVVALQDERGRAELLLAPTTVGRLPWYTGLVGTLGALAWAVGATAALGGSSVARLGGRPRAASFLAHAGIFSLLLCLDDLFELHAGLVPERVGVPKIGVLAVLVGLAVALTIAHRREIARTRRLVLGAALVALGAALAVDVIADPDDSLVLLAEEGSQFLGTVAWALYLWLTAGDVVRSVLRAGPVPVDQRSRASTGSASAS